MQMKQDGQSPITVIEDLSRVLPDTTHLTELRLEPNGIEIGGVAKGAAQLPQLLEQSGSFADARLTSPLTIDAREDAERFNIHTRFAKAKSTP